MKNEELAKLINSQGTQILKIEKAFVRGQREISEITKRVNHMSEDVAEAKTNIKWLKWLVCLLVAGIFFSPLIVRFWALFGV